MKVAMGKGIQELEDIDVVCKALAHCSRRQILVVLNALGGVMTAGEIAKRFSCSWPTTTRHLRQLESAGLVSVERKGREQVYRLNIARLKHSLGKWINYFE
ncbi:MAG: helix-turn-helix transcriptional regulator [Pseudobacteriovorax sp.]|nr:helix-turn-helix transcriptional regulator [Pseudobacteriovorax sp.]